MSLGFIPQHKTLLAIIGSFTIFFFVSNGRADGPATTVASDETPQAFLAYMTKDHLATMNIDQVMSHIDFNPDSDKDRASARLSATNFIATSKLLVAVQEKWGKETETSVAHAFTQNEPEDDIKAQWTIKDDHAVAIYPSGGLTPQLLVKRSGHWKLDMDSYRKAVGDKIKLDQMVQATTTVVEKLTQELAKKDAFTNADEFTRHVRDELGKIVAPN